VVDFPDIEDWPEDLEDPEEDKYVSTELKSKSV